MIRKMKVNLIDSSAQISLSEKVFGQEVNTSLIHQAVISYLATQRQGSKAQKTRAEVRGGGKKPWRQKGTGRARVGSSRNPVWRGGGVTFAAKPRSFKQKINRKMYQGALHSILSALVKDNRVAVISSIVLKQPKTKELLAFLAKYNLINKGKESKKVCKHINIRLVVKELNENLVYASRNLPGVSVVKVSDISAPFLVGADKLLMTRDACEELNDYLSK